MTEVTGFDALYGLEYENLGDDEVRAHVSVDGRHLQPIGFVHGGVYAAMAESVASVGTWHANQDKTVAGLSNHTSYLRPAFAGDTVTAVAVPRHRGRTTWVWEVEIVTQEGKTAALSRVTVAVR
jgi:uncharacterized protein (TIGR00369 family)